MDPLQPGFSYLGPTGTDDADLCKCNTVVYNLLSACDGCQGQTWITYFLFLPRAHPSLSVIQLVPILGQLHKDTSRLDVRFALRLGLGH
jgi:hypothetical protein